MKINLKKILVIVLSSVLFTTPAFVNAAENNASSSNTESYTTNFTNSDNTIITIDGSDYNAQKFMDRVLKYTITSNPIDTMQAENGSKIKFKYNEMRQRTNKTTEEGTTTYSYDSTNNLISEILPNGNIVEYSYTLKDGYETPASISYQNTTYYYFTDENGIITGLVDANNQVVCEYEYDKNGSTKHIYAIKDAKKTKHKDNSGDNFIGCVNSLRYDGKCYDSETGMFCTNTGSYYDTSSNKVVGDDSHVDLKGLFGDQYGILSNANNSSNTISSYSISSTEQQQLLYAASVYYSNNLNSFGTSYSSSTWYTSFSSSTMHYLLATRIIYAENNNYSSSDSTLETYLMYNREGVAWEITNRLLEDLYRYNKGYNQYFSVNNSPATSPSLYTVLTKPSAFTSIDGSNAKGAIASSNPAFQEALWLACCINVCSNFDQWNAVVSRPTGITSQCYNRGSLTTSSSPSTTWNLVVFPGWSTDYSGKSSYSGFTYLSSISKFNIVFGLSESLYIKSVYY